MTMDTKMSYEDKWIEIPILLDHEDYLRIEKYFTRLGIKYQGKPVTTRVGITGADHSYSVYVTEDHVPASALVFRHFLDIQDPASEEPFTGACPACGERIVDAWTCPSCEISFRGEYDEDSPMVVFIRQYGGFNDP